MNAQTRLRFAKGVKLRREPDGRAMLLVPEGVLMLNETAAATLELVDGERSIDRIVEAIVERFEVTPVDAYDDVCALLEQLVQRRLIDAVTGPA